MDEEIDDPRSYIISHVKQLVSSEVMIQTPTAFKVDAPNHRLMVRAKPAKWMLFNTVPKKHLARKPELNKC